MRTRTRQQSRRTRRGARPNGAGYCRDYDPPHFHAIYGEHQAQIAIGTLEAIGGSLPRHAMRLVTEWAGQHARELESNWQKARLREPLDTIEPLE